MPNNMELEDLIHRAKAFDTACILVSNGFADAHGRFELMAGYGIESSCTQLEALRTDKLQFGFFAYDLKNQFENLVSNHPAWIEVPDMFFFEPQEYYLRHRDGNVTENLKPHTVDAVSNAQDFRCNSWECSVSREAYLNTIHTIRNNIREGDYYELNFCTEWRSNYDGTADPYNLFLELNQKAPAPFAVFFKHGNTFLLSSSPERFINGSGNKVVSQPIKGTRKRLPGLHEDAQVRTELMTSEKDRAENIMITDLVRNDLSIFCKPGTVEVEELCGIYSFSHVHQMISTVSAEMRDGMDLRHAIRSTFPMGSMTGAPKIKVMEVTEELEGFRRGLYSGSVGYTFNGNFDFNVVIRALQLDTAKSRIAYHVGGAITYDSHPESEYEECIAKAQSMLSVIPKS
jgi:para-aminobenzoate synthetase component I